MPYCWTDMILYFFIYSFCGWLMETVLCSVTQRRFINRGFLNGPICPIYGCGILLILIFLIPVRDSVSPLGVALPVIFFAGAVLASAVEYATSWVMEKAFKARWWDYSDKKFNVNGRICLEISFAWGGLATGFLYLVQPLFEKLVAYAYAVNHSLPRVLAAILLLVFVLDVVISVRVACMIGNKLEQLDKWAEYIREHAESLSLPSKEAIQAKLEAVYERYAKLGSRLYTRLTDELHVPFSDWTGLSLESAREKLQEYIEQLNEKRESMIKNTRLLQRRMLRAFPNMQKAHTVSLPDVQSYINRRRSKSKQESEKKE